MTQTTEEFKKVCKTYTFLRRSFSGVTKVLIEGLFTEIKRLEDELMKHEGDIGPRGHPGQASGKLLCQELGVPPNLCVCQGKGKVPCEALRK